jgi:mono/diheme cytochrome c family protein
MNSPRSTIFGVAALLIAAGAFSQEVEIDSATGFKMTGDWELVRANCVACHSAKLVTQQRGTAAQWLTLIRWMQAKQNLWQFDPDVEKKIVTYLAENYAPQANRRRAAIPLDLMPPNPYAPESNPPEG